MINVYQEKLRGRDVLVAIGGDRISIKTPGEIAPLVQIIVFDGELVVDAITQPQIGCVKDLEFKTACYNFALSLINQIINKDKDVDKILEDDEKIAYFDCPVCANEMWTFWDDYEN